MVRNIEYTTVQLAKRNIRVRLAFLRAGNRHLRTRQTQVASDHVGQRVVLLAHNAHPRLTQELSHKGTDLRNAVFADKIDVHGFELAQSPREPVSMVVQEDVDISLPGRLLWQRRMGSIRADDEVEVLDVVCARDDAH